MRRSHNRVWLVESGVDGLSMQGEHFTVIFKLRLIPQELQATGTVVPGLGLLGLLITDVFRVGACHHHGRDAFFSLVKQVAELVAARHIAVI